MNPFLCVDVVVGRSTLNFGKKAYSVRHCVSALQSLWLCMAIRSRMRTTRNPAAMRPRAAKTS